jgi:hypothetical protein
MLYNTSTVHAQVRRCRIYLYVLVGKIVHKECNNAACKPILLQAKWQWFKSTYVAAKEEIARDMIDLVFWRGISIGGGELTRVLTL